MTTEERVRRLEREVRWTRVVGALAVLALACGVLVGAGQDQGRVLDEVKTKRLLVVGDDGKARASLRVEKGGQVVGLDLIDNKGHPRTRLFLGDGYGSELKFHDEKGRVRVTAYAMQTGAAGISVNDHEQQRAAVLCSSDTNGLLVLYDKGTGKPKFVAPSK
jgi:hypothetical protein